MVVPAYEHHKQCRLFLEDRPRRFHQEGIQAQEGLDRRPARHDLKIQGGWQGPQGHR